ncbi:hypothetical protein HJC23_007306 [Cyclotella cryptica]|uniref:SEC7 domain-containing protein n=1 Tax=Cyclotella cryptica TaxID=29204 RepID=A0ABD3P0G1_9STRA
MIAISPINLLDLIFCPFCLKDINSSNLFETICITLAKVANPDKGQIDTFNTEPDKNNHEGASIEHPELPYIGGHYCCGWFDSTQPLTLTSQLPNFALSIVGTLPPDSGNLALIGDTLCINRDFHHDTKEYIFCSYLLCSDSFTSNQKVKYASARTNSYISEINLEEISKQNITLCLEREKKSKAMPTIPLAHNYLRRAVFNKSTRGKDCFTELERLTPKSIAIFLHLTLKLDKTKIGGFISKGPKEKYPFLEKVLEEFTLCIDQLMEAFTRRLYKTQMTSKEDDNAEKTMLDPLRGESYSISRAINPPTSDEAQDVLLPFQSADTVFILVFSTNMLNTDLHNPNMNDEKCMTLEQFIKNSRGINGGADLPREFLQDLYFEI